jgi:GT2 family glycosyltransferase/glycosyltransferase involved in cell wall biosynthesis
MPPPNAPAAEGSRENGIVRAMAGFFDAEWYRTRYADIAASGVDPLHHFIHHGLAERRDPNGFFDSAWYAEHYSDIGASGLNPLLHYLQAGAAELRNPHPRFDAVYYADAHPEAAANPLLYHLRVGAARGYATEKPVDIRGYLPSKHRAAGLPRGVAVAVVIPVYRGLEETRSCINSVIADRGTPQRRIIVVEDRSPEPALVAWLRKVATEGEIELIRNRRNLGFVASVNAGMAAAGRDDVVLLNSDTEVPPGWLRRLTAQAYAEPRIASVSPFSNNAMICGYPDNGGGPIVFGQNVAQLDEVCRSVNSGRAIGLPTTVGFCMYIRRQALDEVGVFDAERFTVGYGEENDFCLRATALGWGHRLACDVFVYHKGSVSFGDRVKKLSARAMKLILERYPDYGRAVARHVSLDAIAPFRFAITAALFRQSKRPVILMVSHSLGGGIDRHIETLTERYRDHAHILRLEGTDRGAALSVPALPDHPVLTLPPDRVDDMVSMLRSMNVTRVHLHHLAGMDMDIRTLIHRLDVPFDVTVHDYHGICPQINLLPWRHSLYCGEPDLAGCNACITHRSSNHSREIVMWRAERAWQFREAARVLCPSADALARLQRNGLADRAILAPHEPVAAAPWPLHIARIGKARLRIAVLGTLVNHKGALTVAAVAEAMDPKTTELHLIGHTDGPFPEAARKRMKMTGRYDDPDLPTLIDQIAPHIIWFPIAWPETFSYTLSAAIDSGIAIAATDIGAFTERLAGRPYTWMADIATAPFAWIELFEEIRNSLVAATPTPSVAPRPSIRDFYEMDYLRPIMATPAIRASHAAKRASIAVVPERFSSGNPTPAAYIRQLQPLHHPAIAGDFDVMVTDANSVFDYQTDVIATQRHAIPDVATADALAAHARKTGATLLFDLDDDLLNVPAAKVVRRMLDHADIVWVSTPALAERLASIRSDGVVIEDRLDERIWTHAAPPSTFQQEPVRILCMGAATHSDEFAMIEPALVRLKAEYGARVVIDVLGMTDRSELPAGLNRIRPSTHASQSYPGFVHWLNATQPRWHIGLAPLLDTPFNRCKSPIKALDYAAMGLFVLASDMPVYRGSIADGPAGQLVPNSTLQWYAALNWLMRNEDLRRATAARSRAAFVANYTLATHAPTRRSAWTQLLRTVPASVSRAIGRSA